MRALCVALLVSVMLGCGDDDDDTQSDAGSDAAAHAMHDADVARDADIARDAEAPRMDARVPNAGHPTDASSAVEAGDAAPCGLEPSYIWASFGCEPAEGVPRSAQRVTLTEFCQSRSCPADWDAALDESAACDEMDAGWRGCWSATTTRCGAHLLEAIYGPDERFLYYDHATGELIGAAIQLTDVDMSPECIASELIAGEQPPVCCDDGDAA
jgi:hypothetical protein